MWSHPYRTAYRQIKTAIQTHTLQPLATPIPAMQKNNLQLHTTYQITSQYTSNNLTSNITTHVIERATNTQ
ncbi:hypothetical protein B9J09_08050 [Xylella fastidiosa subsp. pauca]|uniref:hypothetical protein n=1 Tax=Xylella fastidiosa TaxID=2371 RepID=UPI000582555F|nr:hypothetical protein [Xylella fastidiosa]ARO68989.1 hypothetical protein B9J09_08050 [Xylella fastidiosa subsp. pauca]AVI21046.1 hypothetical protein BCV75_07530 [Xylella fastidiosa]AVI23070.1 hypothetical protein BC375_07590 [Xylella fastidiosa]KIA58106.1 hypothetical protein RA12_06135 [Xylella fastidiosa]KXB10068.1 hypothetical protein ADT32_10160 [Xylella fastidiosa]